MSAIPSVSPESTLHTTLEKLKNWTNNSLDLFRTGSQKLQRFASKILNMLSNVFSFVRSKGIEWGSFIFQRGRDLLSSAFKIVENTKGSLGKIAQSAKELLIENKQKLGLIGAGIGITLALVGVYHWITQSEESS